MAGIWLTSQSHLFMLKITSKRGGAGFFRKLTQSDREKNWVIFITTTVFGNLFNSLTLSIPYTAIGYVFRLLKLRIGRYPKMVIRYTVYHIRYIINPLNQLAFWEWSKFKKSIYFNTECNGKISKYFTNKGWPLSFFVKPLISWPLVSDLRVLLAFISQALSRL